MKNNATTVNDLTSSATAKTRRRSALTLYVSGLVLFCSAFGAGTLAIPIALGSLGGGVAAAITLLSERYRSKWPLALLGLTGVVPLAMSPIPFNERDFFFYALYIGATFFSASVVSLLYTALVRKSHEA